MKRPFVAPDVSRPPFALPPEVLTAAQFRARAKPKRHKYGVGPAEDRTVDGRVFASIAEARRYGELKLLERAGFIRKLELQPRLHFAIDGKIIFTYVGDFRYLEGCLSKLEDVKGVRTPVYRLKKKLIEAQHRIKIIEVA